MATGHPNEQRWNLRKDYLLPVLVGVTLLLIGGIASRLAGGDGAEPSPPAVTAPTPAQTAPLVSATRQTGGDDQISPEEAIQWCFPTCSVYQFSSPTSDPTGGKADLYFIGQGATFALPEGVTASFMLCQGEVYDGAGPVEVGGVCYGWLWRE